MTQINILIVDDNKVFASQCSKYLSTVENFNVVGIANDGVEAIKFIENIKIDVIVLDSIMPNLDGWGVIRFVNELDFNRPQIIVTSFIDNFNHINNLYNYGIADYMLKPFSMENLTKKILSLKNNIIFHDPKLIEAEIIKKLYDLRVPTNLKGYKYIKMAVYIILKKDINYVKISEIYKKLSDEYICSEEAIEYAIRNCLEITFNEGNIDELNKLFNYNSSKNNGKVSNKEFIYRIAQDLNYNNVLSKRI